MRRPLIAGFLLVVLCCVAAPATAWGTLGHRLIAALAWDALTPRTRAAVAALLVDEPDPTLAGVANWADALRGSDPGLGRRSARWHYVNLAEDDCRYDATRDCRGGACIVGAIHAQRAILADHQRSRAEHAQALKFLVHLVGDLHQPLHAGFAHDRGGNTVQTSLDGRGGNLHSLWDGGLIRSGGLSEPDHLQRLRALPEIPLASHAGAAAAAEASCRVVMRAGFYPPRARIDPAYLLRWRPVADRQLRRAGADLAAHLNAALAP